jgi:hypothetical protein
MRARRVAVGNPRSARQRRATRAKDSPVQISHASLIAGLCHRLGFALTAVWRWVSSEPLAARSKPLPETSPRGQPVVDRPFPRLAGAFAPKCRVTR